MMTISGGVRQWARRAAVVAEYPWSPPAGVVLLVVAVGFVIGRIEHVCR